MVADAPKFSSGRTRSPRSRTPTIAGVNERMSEQFTGRFIVVFADASTSDIIASFEQSAGLRVATSSDFSDRAVAAATDNGGFAFLLESLRIAVVDAPPEQMDRVAGAATAGMHVVPERYMYAAGAVPFDSAYLDGLEDGAAAIVARLKARFHGMEQRALPVRSDARAQIAASEHTWNLIRVGVPRSKFIGRGIKLAILDTGYDRQHPDFAGRSIVSRSFVPDESVQDGNGHGTHCLGIACGGRQVTSVGPIYGCAAEAQILVGKVLGDNGRAEEGWVLNGINWALEQGADIVSMSIEGPPDAPPEVMTHYEAIGARALAQKRLLIAAAGNRSVRPLFTRPVASPANATSIMAVAALSPDDTVAPFSCAGGGGINVDIAAPGVAIESSFPAPRTRKVDSGTSMAAPLVAGVAALFAESDPRLRGVDLWKRMIASASTLSSPVEDVGAGCVQAP